MDKLCNLLERDFLFVSGKGGVGKSTVAATLALHASQTGKRVLLAQCNARDQVHTVLQVERFEAQCRRILPNFDAVNMNPKDAVDEYAMMVLKLKSVFRAVVGNRIAQSFIHGIPGMDAWSMLGKAYYHATRDVDERGQKRYDLVIVDGPATGHGLEMLAVPQVIKKVAPPGLLRVEAERAITLMEDESKSAIVLVTLPQEMPIAETLELHHSISEKTRYPTGAIIVNRTLHPIFKAQGEPKAHALRTDEPSAQDPVKKAANIRRHREQLEHANLRALHREISLPTANLPEREHPSLTRADLADFGSILF